MARSSKTDSSEEAGRLTNVNPNPYAMLNRGQSKRAAAVPVGEGLQDIMARRTEAPPYEDLINFPRAKDKDEIRCVMCGLPPGTACIIPRQNKDVCKECDKATWQHVSTMVYFKWCKGCKKFLRLGCFSEKLDAAKCDRCRERGRQSYLLKKGKDGTGPFERSGGTRSRSESMSSVISLGDRDDLSDVDLATAAAAMAAVTAAARATNCGAGASFLAHQPAHGHHSQSGNQASDHVSLVSSSGDDEQELGEYSPNRCDSDIEERQTDVYSNLSSDSYAGLDDVYVVSHRRGAGRRGACFGAQGRMYGGQDYRPSSPSLTVSPDDRRASPVIIDDDGADVTKSKLSSVFGIPLRDLAKRKRIPEPVVSNCVGSTPASCEEGVDGPDVSNTLRGTLYELACIHQRIVTLEEHAEKVQWLESMLEAKEGQMKKIRADSDQLRADLESAKDSEQQCRKETEALKTEVAVLRERQASFDLSFIAGGADPFQKHQQQAVPGEARGPAIAGEPEVKVETNAAQGMPSARALQLVSACVMDREQKRPRLVFPGSDSPSGSL